MCLLLGDGRFGRSCWACSPFSKTQGHLRRCELMELADRRSISSTSSEEVKLVTQSPSGTRSDNQKQHLQSRWEWSPEEIKRVGYRVIDLIAQHLTEVLQEPVFRPFPPDLASKYINSTLPETGQEPDEILDTFVREI